MATLGKRNLLSIVRESTPGLYLDGGTLGEILLPGRYIPADIKPKDKLDVFVYRDSEDRLVATTEIPHATVGEFAFLNVVSINDRVGAFLDWGLPKDLLLPFREQQKPLHLGQSIVVFIYLDSKSGRIVATTRLKRHLSQSHPIYRSSQSVNLLITDATPLGYQAIVENSHSGLLYRDNVTAPLQIGKRLQGYVRYIHPNGKMDLSLDAAGYKRVANLTDQIIQAVESSGGRLDFDDDSSPAAIHEKFSVSKKAFKQALGFLFKTRRIRFLKPGIQLIGNASWSPSKRTGNAI